MTDKTNDIKSEVLEMAVNIAANNSHEDINKMVIGLLNDLFEFPDGVDVNDPSLAFVLYNDNDVVTIEGVKYIKYPSAVLKNK